MPDPRFLLVRLGSLGDVIHALPAAAALRDAFPSARIDWAIAPVWARILEGNPDLNEAIPFDRKTASGVASTIRKLRAARYTCAIDFQALYKSALLACFSGASRRIGFASSYARERLAALCYTETCNPRGPHKVDHNLTLAAAAGAQAPSAPRFPLSIHPENEEEISRELSSRKISDFFVLNPGGGWRSKCWPPDRYGQLHRALIERFPWRGVVTFGPGEEPLARAVIEASGNPPPVALPLKLGPLMALCQRAKFVVSADTGPLHLASALGAPVVGLYGPTDPSRNGPFSTDDVIVRNPGSTETTYDRGASFSTAMLSITVEQVTNAVERRIGARRG
ncbi:MAG: glycosyltransferase family 9 protein [Candidatus Acidiferrales bacterium]